MGPKINLNAKLFAQKQINLFCDVILIAKADKKRIRVHRCVLYAASEYFEALLTADMKEKDLEKIELDGVSGAVLGQLVDYVYTGHIDVNVANAHDILAAADLFLFNEVTQICEQVLAGAIETTNAFDFLAIAEKYRLNSLQLAAQKFVHDRFSDIIEDVAFLGLEVGTLIGYLASDDIGSGTEEDIFNAIAKWISVDSMTRKQHYAALMGTVRMSKINIMFLLCQILEFSDSLNMHRVFTDVCREKYRQDVKATDAERKAFGPFMFVAVASEGDLFQIEQYNFMSNTWVNSEVIVKGLSGGYHNLCIKKCLYFFAFEGGTRVVRIPLAAMMVEARKPINSVKKYYTCIAVGQFVYCIGGQDAAGHILDSVQTYDTENDDWMEIGKLNRGRCKAHAAVLAGKIYVVGGFDTAALQAAERYDPKTGHWTTVADLNVARYKHRCCAIGEFIYAVGGHNITNNCMASVERYDEQLNRWTIILHELDVPLAHFEIAAFGQWIYIAGGEGGSNAYSKSKAFQRMNVIDGRIERLASMNHEILFYQ